MSIYLEVLAELEVGGAHPGGLRLSKKILETLDIDEETKILDVGCGTGQTMAYIAERYGCKVTGIDVQEKMVEKANHRFKDFSYQFNVRGGMLNLYHLIAIHLTIYFQSLFSLLLIWKMLLRKLKGCLRKAELL